MSVLILNFPNFQKNLSQFKTNIGIKYTYLSLSPITLSQIIHIKKVITY